MYQNVIFICISRCNQNWPFLVIFHADVSRTERVIYMGQMFKNEPNKICGTQPLRNLKGMVCLSKGRLTQILVGPFLNTLSRISLGITVPSFIIIGYV